MDIYDYFYKRKKETGFELRDFAKMIDITATHLSLLINGRTPPSFKLAQKIEDITDGEVTLVEMFSFAQQKLSKKPKKAYVSRKKRRVSSPLIGEQMELNI